MLKIVSVPNCGNSPKMEFIKQFNIAFAECDVKTITASVSDDIVWDIIGDKKIEGINNFAAELETMNTNTATELILKQVLSHGKEGAANGLLTMQNGNQFAFSDFYIFKSSSGTKIKAITSYVIEV